VEGLLLRLLNDIQGAPGRWFWECFEPLRAEFDWHFWVFTNQPWMGAPPDFLEDAAATLDYEGMSTTSVQLWRPGTLGRWAEHMCEEYIELWAVDPADNPRQVTSRFLRSTGQSAGYIAGHASIWLLYTDSTCWEIYARDSRLLRNVRAHVAASRSVQAYSSWSENRGRAFAQAGVGGVWRAINGRPS
jgi:hypothetical protein